MKAAYEKLCVRCRLGWEPTRTDVHGTTIWLHDGIYQCGAASIREQEFKAEQEKKKNV